MLQKFIRHSKVKITVYDTLGAFISLLSIYKKKTDLFRYRLPQSNALIQCCMQYHEYHIVSSSGHELELCSSSYVSYSVFVKRKVYYYMNPIPARECSFLDIKFTSLLENLGLPEEVLLS